MTRGDTYTFDVTITRSSSPVDLTGASFWCTAKNSLADDDVDAVFQKTLSSGIAVVGAAANGKIRVTIAATDTATLSHTATTALQIDVQMKESTNQVTTVAQGTLTVTPDVTLSTS
jgi:hypothetical protein